MHACSSFNMDGYNIYGGGGGGGGAGGSVGCALEVKQ